MCGRGGGGEKENLTTVISGNLNNFGLSAMDMADDVDNSFSIS